MSAVPPNFDRPREPDGQPARRQRAGFMLVPLLLSFLVVAVLLRVL